MDEWVKAYRQACAGATINYQAHRIGRRHPGIHRQHRDFAGSDSALKAGDEQTKANARCTGGQALDLPMVIGPIAVAYNLDRGEGPPAQAGHAGEDLRRYDQDLGRPRDQGRQLGRDAAVDGDHAVHRSDSSGTTDNFTKYLTAAAGADWTFSNDKVWKAPGGRARPSPTASAAAVKQTAGAIGYIEQSFAQTSGLSMAKIYNGAGEYTAGGRQVRRQGDRRRARSPVPATTWR